MVGVGVAVGVNMRHNIHLPDDVGLRVLKLCGEESSRRGGERVSMAEMLRRLILRGLSETERKRGVA